MVMRCALCWRRLEDHQSTTLKCPPRKWGSPNEGVFKEIIPPPISPPRKATREECDEQARDELESGLEK